MAKVNELRSQSSWFSVHQKAIYLGFDLISWKPFKDKLGLLEGRESPCWLDEVSSHVEEAHEKDFLHLVFRTPRFLGSPPTSLAGLLSLLYWICLILLTSKCWSTRIFFLHTHSPSELKSSGFKCHLYMHDSQIYTSSPNSLWTQYFHIQLPWDVS